MKDAFALSAAAIALLIGSDLAAPPAEAAYVVDLTQVADPSQPSGFDVVATGSGSIDLTDLTLTGTGTDLANVNSAFGRISTGPETLSGADFYASFSLTGPLAFGSRGLVIANSGSGDMVGVFPFEGIFPTELLVPTGYVSGHALSDTSTYDNATFASLGVTPGIYKWTWGTGAHADSFTLIAVIPEPSTWALMALGFGLLGVVGWRSRRRSVAVAA
jgi:hypothetical protein